MTSPASSVLSINTELCCVLHSMLVFIGFLSLGNIMFHLFNQVLLNNKPNTLFIEFHSKDCFRSFLYLIEVL